MRLRQLLVLLRNEHTKCLRFSGEWLEDASQDRRCERCRKVDAYLMSELPGELNGSEIPIVLLALAKLAVERPGWTWICEVIAMKLGDRADDRSGLPVEFTKLLRVEKGLNAESTEIELKPRRIRSRK